MLFASRMMKTFRPLVPVFALVMTALSACSHTWVHSEYQQPQGFATWSDAPATAYQIQPGDELAINLPFNSELNYRGPVAPDGTLAMPFAGTIHAGGLTTAQLADNINKALMTAGVTANAHASVGIAQTAARVYVGGQVKQPGQITLEAGMSVMQAIMAAQGLLDTARTHEVVVIRRSPDGRPMMRTVDLDALTHRGDPRQDIVLRPTDTIFVPKSSIAEVDQWVDQNLNQAIPFTKGFSYSITNNPGVVR